MPSEACILPGEHISHAVCPDVLVYFPLPQLVHSSILDMFEYRPEAQAVQMLAPVLLPVLVIEPASHV